jgi:hypothetical protein
VALLAALAQLAAELGDFGGALVLEDAGRAGGGSGVPFGEDFGARFIVARLTPASRQRLFLVSLPSVCGGWPDSSRSTASRRACSVLAQTVTGLPYLEYQRHLVQLGVE